MYVHKICSPHISIYGEIIYIANSAIVYNQKNTKYIFSLVLNTAVTWIHLYVIIVLSKWWVSREFIVLFYFCICWKMLLLVCIPKLLTLHLCGSACVCCGVRRRAEGCACAHTLVYLPLCVCLYRADPALQLC